MAEQSLRGEEKKKHDIWAGMVSWREERGGVAAWRRERRDRLGEMREKHWLTGMALEAGGNEAHLSKSCARLLSLASRHASL